jgi:hypothetical protein
LSVLVSFTASDYLVGIFKIVLIDDS